MKIKIDEFLIKLLAALTLCMGIFNVYMRESTFVLYVGIFFISISVSIFMIDSINFEISSKSKVEKAEEKANKHKKKLENKVLKQCNKEYKILKKEIFKRIAKNYSTIVISSYTEPEVIICTRLNCDIDFKELHFTVHAGRIYWERK